MIGIATIPSLLYALLCVGLPESPRRLLGRKRDRVQGIRVLKMIQPTASEAQIDAEADAIVRTASVRSDKGAFWSHRGDNGPVRRRSGIALVRVQEIGVVSEETVVE